MLFRVLADIVLTIHLLWIVFMLAIFLLTAIAFVRIDISKENSMRSIRFINRWFLRTFHLAGIVYVGSLAAMGKYCPLTTLENYLREKSGLSPLYQDSFIAYYLEKIVYPSVPPMVIIVPTIIVALVTLLAYVIHPPEKITGWRHKARPGS